MFNRVVDWAVQNRLLVLIALAVLISTAAFQIPKLNLDAFPDVTNVQVAVNTEAPGLAAEEVEQLITYPIEAVMYALPDVEDRVIEFPESLLMQHHESHAGNRFGHRVDAEERVHCHWCLVVDACKACALECGNLAVTRE